MFRATLGKGYNYQYNLTTKIMHSYVDVKENSINMVALNEKTFMIVYG